MKLKALASALFAVACLGSASASAAVVFSSDGFDAKDASFSSFLNLQKFDSTLGTLTGVYFELHSDVVSKAVFTNDTKKAKFVSGTVDTTLTVERPDGTILFASPSTSLISLDKTSVAAFSSYSAPGSASIALSGNVGAADFGLFTGSGALSAPLLLDASTHFSAANVGVVLTTTASAHASVRYTYTAAVPVPEPETYGMMLFGLGMLAFVAKRKARSNRA
jgi:hypothetical protein